VHWITSENGFNPSVDCYGCDPLILYDKIHWELAAKRLKTIIRVWAVAVIVLLGLLVWFILFNPTATPTIRYTNGVVVKGDCDWLQTKWEAIRDDTHDEICENVCLERFCPYGILNESNDTFISSTNVISIRDGSCWEACFK